MRLLVVEDESLIAYEVACAIEDHLDSEVVAVTTTTSALEMIAARNFDAAIVDVKLKDGTSERLAAGAASEKHTLFLLTGCPTQGELPAPLDRGKMLKKPYEESELIVALAILAETAWKQNLLTLRQ